MMKIVFTCNSVGGENELSVAMFKPVKVMMNEWNASGVTLKVKRGYVVQYVINGLIIVVK